MAHRLPFGLIFAVVCSFTAPAVAELSGDDYAPARAITSDAERARTQALIDAARAREAERAGGRSAGRGLRCAHLSRTQPATTPGAIVDYGGTMLLIAGVLFALHRAARRRPRR